MTTLVVKKRLKEILSKARQGRGLSPEEVGEVFGAADEGDWQDIFESARTITRDCFRNRIHLFAPLYFSNCCVNECAYCGFKRSNRLLKRSRLTPEELLREADYLWREGHRSVLLVAAEHPVLAGPLRIATYLYRMAKQGYDFEISLEVGPFEEYTYRELRELGVKRYVLYQETYDRRIYAAVHKEGSKRHFDWRLGAAGRALHAGIENVGIGILLGLADYRSDLVELVRHAYRLRDKFGRLPATLSFPRLRPAWGGDDFGYVHTVIADEEFEKIVALARIALPSVGITLTTRETPEFRDRLLERGIGITHVSAGVSTSPGGYTIQKDTGERAQFDIADHRSLKEITKIIQKKGYLPVYMSGDEPTLRCEQ